MGLVVDDDGWRIPDELWAEVQPLIPPGKPHPLGCHNPRVADRDAMDAILFVLRTGCQWEALNATDICSKSSAHRRFQEWTEAGVFRDLWNRGLLAYEQLQGIEWEWQALDAAMTKAPLGGGENRSQSHGPGQERHQTEPADRRSGRTPGGRHRWGQPARLPTGA
jgi:transposase